VGLRGTDGIRGRGVSIASRPSTRASKPPVTQLVFVALGAFPRSTPCVCALRGFLPGRVFPHRTTRRHGLGCPPPNWVGWAERVVTFGGAVGQEGNSTFLGVVAVRQPASGGTSLVLFPMVPSAAGGAPQRQVWLSPAGSMADGGGNGDPPGVQVPGAGGDGSSSPEADRRLTIATSVQAPRMRVPAGRKLCSSPCPRASIRLGLAPRQAPPRVGLTPSRSCRVLALLSA